MYNLKLLDNIDNYKIVFDIISNYLNENKDKSTKNFSLEGNVSVISLFDRMNILLRQYNDKLINDDFTKLD
jgi:hypothetical protein